MVNPNTVIRLLIRLCGKVNSQNQHHNNAQSNHQTPVGYPGAAPTHAAPQPSQQQPYYAQPSPQPAATGPFYAQAYFFPSEDSFRQLLAFINSAQRSLEICVFTISDDDLARAIIAAHQRGVRVRIISDDQQAQNKGSDTIRLGRESGIPVIFDNAAPHMHNKFAIADGQAVVTGSYNWTKGARRDNQENIVISNSTDLVRAFGGEFEKLWRKFGGP